MTSQLASIGEFQSVHFIAMQGEVQLLKQTEDGKERKTGESD
jgi:hypothetical protein